MKTLCEGGPLHGQEIEVSDKAATFTCSTEGKTFNYIKVDTLTVEGPKFICEDC